MSGEEGSRRKGSPEVKKEIGEHFGGGVRDRK